MSNESIKTDFNYAGGIVEAEISATSAYITFEKDGKTVIIDDSYGDVFRFDDPNYSLLHGAAKAAFEESEAKKFAIEAIGSWIVFASEQLEAIQ